MVVAMFNPHPLINGVSYIECSLQQEDRKLFAMSPIIKRLVAFLLGISDLMRPSSSSRRSFERYLGGPSLRDSPAPRGPRKNPKSLPVQPQTHCVTVTLGQMDP